MFFDTAGYHVLPEPRTARSPESNVPYAVASTDLNPIHRNEWVESICIS